MWEQPDIVRLQGRILDHTGSPVPHATVTMWLENDDEMGGDETDAVGGWFTVSETEDEFENKQIHIMVEQPKDASGVDLDLQPTMLEDIDPSQPIVVRMEPGAALSGRVIDESGAPGT